jgi:hypothetical protein
MYVNASGSNTSGYLHAKYTTAMSSERLIGCFVAALAFALSRSCWLFPKSLPTLCWQRVAASEDYLHYRISLSVATGWIYIDMFTMISDLLLWLLTFGVLGLSACARHLVCNHASLPSFSHHSYTL